MFLKDDSHSSRVPMTMSYRTTCAPGRRTSFSSCSWVAVDETPQDGWRLMGREFWRWELTKTNVAEMVIIIGMNIYSIYFPPILEWTRGWQGFKSIAKWLWAYGVKCWLWKPQKNRCRQSGKQLHFVHRLHLGTWTSMELQYLVTIGLPIAGLPKAYSERPLGESKGIWFCSREHLGYPQREREQREADVCGKHWSNSQVVTVKYHQISTYWWWNVQVFIVTFQLSMIIFRAILIKNENMSWYFHTLIFANLHVFVSKSTFVVWVLPRL